MDRDCRHFDMGMGVVAPLRSFGTLWVTGGIFPISVSWSWVVGMRSGSGMTGVPVQFLFRSLSLGLDQNTRYVEGTKHADCSKEAVHWRDAKLLNRRQEQLPQSKVENPVTNHSQRDSSSCMRTVIHSNCTGTVHGCKK